MATGDGSPSVTRLSTETRDATERKRAEEAALENDAILRALLKSASEAIVIVDGDGRIVLVSDRAEEMFGYSRDELVGQTVETLIPNRFRDAHVRLRADYVSHPRVRPMGPGLDLVGRRKDGTEFPVEIGLSFIEKDGGPLIMSLIVDISERRRAEEALRQSEANLADIASSLQDVVWLASPSTLQTLYLNASAEAVYGRPVAEFLANTGLWFEVIHPKDKERVTRHVQASLEDDLAELEYRILRPDGEVRWLHGQRRFARDASGHVTRIVGITTDITTRKRAEEEIRLLLSITQAINAADSFQSTLEAVLSEVCEATGWDYGEAWLSHPDGTVLECNPAWYSATDALTRFRLVSEQTTFPPGVGLPGRVWLSRQPEWIEDLWTRPDTVFFRADAAQEAGLKAGLGIPITANGEVLAVLVFSVSEPREEDRRLVELISAVAQQLGGLFQRKRAEEALRDSKLLLEKTFASLDEAVFVVEPNTRAIIACNSAAERIFGYSEKEMMGRNTEFLHVDRATYENFGRELFPALEADGVFHTEYQVRRKDGSVLFTEHTVTEIVDDSGQRTGLVSVVRDVSDRKRAEEALQMARAELEGRVERQLLRRNPYGLTFRELTVLHLLSAGNSDKEIGIDRGIRPLTARKHISNILTKMDAASRTEAVARCLREGLLD